jgi:hypothetical protein
MNTLTSRPYEDQHNYEQMQEMLMEAQSLNKITHAPKTPA